MKKIVILACVASLSTQATPAHANCKSEVDAALKAQRERDRECDIAAKPITQKTPSQIKQGYSVCKAKQKAYEKAAKRLHDCGRRQR